MEHRRPKTPCKAGVCSELRGRAQRAESYRTVWALGGLRAGLLLQPSSLRRHHLRSSVCREHPVQSGVLGRRPERIHYELQQPLGKP